MADVDSSESLVAQTEVQRISEIIENTASVYNTSEVTQAVCRSFIHCISEFFTLVECQRYMEEKLSCPIESAAALFNGHISNSTEGGRAYLSHAAVSEARRLKNKEKNKKKKEKRVKKKAFALVIEQAETTSQESAPPHELGGESASSSAPPHELGGESASSSAPPPYVEEEGDLPTEQDAADTKSQESAPPHELHSELSMMQYLHEKMESCFDNLWKRSCEKYEINNGEMKAENGKIAKALEELQKNLAELKENVTELNENVAELKEKAIESLTHVGKFGAELDIEEVVFDR